jgi:hypothetical protein
MEEGGEEEEEEEEEERETDEGERERGRYIKYVSLSEGRSGGWSLDGGGGYGQEVRCVVTDI